MPSNTTDAPLGAIVQGGLCRLLELPMELQLSIYELAVPKNELYLLNFACNSSYRYRHADMRADQKTWVSGAKHPPTPPAITQTCRSIRNETLPMFYESNVFRACYCQTEEMKPLVPMLPPAIQWLRQIGQRSREMLRHLYFYDRNERQDLQSPRALGKLKDSEIFTDMGGAMESIYTDNFAAHWVTFGSSVRRPGEVPLARQQGAQERLRMEGEV